MSLTSLTISRRRMLILMTALFICCNCPASALESCSQDACVQQCLIDDCRKVCSANAKQCAQEGIAKNNILTCEASNTCAQRCSGENCEMTCKSKTCNQKCSSGDCKAVCTKEVEVCNQACTAKKCDFFCYAKTCSHACTLGECTINHSASVKSSQIVMLIFVLIVYTVCGKY